MISDTIGVDGIESIVTSKIARSLSQPLIIWLTQNCCTPTLSVEGIIVELPVPPIAEVYQTKESPIADNGGAISF